jgi:hypothetical protein
MPPNDWPPNWLACAWNWLADGIEPIDCIEPGPLAGAPLAPRLANMGELPDIWPPPLAASKAALYDEAGANEGIDCDKNGLLDRGPNDGGELIEEPNEALNGE